MPEPGPNAQDAALALEVYQRQLDAMSRQMELVQSTLDEVGRAKRSLEALTDEKSDDVLFPLGASTFIRGKLQAREIVITGIGAGYATEKSRPDAVAMLAERETQLRQDMERLMQGAVQLQQEAAELQDRIEGDSGPSAQ